MTATITMPDGRVVEVNDVVITQPIDWRCSYHQNEIDFWKSLSNAYFSVPATFHWTRVNISSDAWFRFTNSMSTGALPFDYDPLKTPTIKKKITKKRINQAFNRDPDGTKALEDILNKAKRHL